MEAVNNRIVLRGEGGWRKPALGKQVRLATPAKGIVVTPQTKCLEAEALHANSTGSLQWAVESWLAGVTVWWLWCRLSRQ